MLVNKRARRDDSDSCLPSASNEDLSKAEKSNVETEDVCTDNQVSGSDENNKATQTDFTRHELSSKIETIILKNELKANTKDCVKIVNKLSYEVVSKDSIQMKSVVHMSEQVFSFPCLFKTPTLQPAL